MDKLPDSLSSVLLPDLNGCTGWSAKSMHLLSQDMIYTGFQIHGPVGILMIQVHGITF